MEITKSDTQPSFAVPKYVWVLLGVLGVVAYFVGLNLPFLGPDEPRYAQVAREMFERGDWVTPTLGGFHWFEKPALLYWLEIVSYNIFGVNEFAARFGPTLFGLGTVRCRRADQPHLQNRRGPRAEAQRLQSARLEGIGSAPRHRVFPWRRLGGWLAEAVLETLRVSRDAWHGGHRSRLPSHRKGRPRSADGLRA